MINKEGGRKKAKCFSCHLSYFPENAEGNSTSAEDNSTNAEDNSTNAEDNSTNAESNSSNAESNSTNAEGCSTIAEGNSTNAEGYPISMLSAFCRSSGVSMPTVSMSVRPTLIL